jgi:ribosomal-protein-alanine N-acetyltransferase
MFFSLSKIFKDINTQRLILREPRLSDIDDIYELCIDENSCKYVNWDIHTDKRQTASYIKYLRKQIAIYDTQSYTWFVENRADGRVIATISLVELDQSGKIATVGYTFNGKYQHKGYATEALSALIKYLFYERDVERIEAKVLPENVPSLNLLERVGMKKEAFLKKGVFCKKGLVDVFIYSILRENFR